MPYGRQKVRFPTPRQSKSQNILCCFAKTSFTELGECLSGSLGKGLQFQIRCRLCFRKLRVFEQTFEPSPRAHCFFSLKQLAQELPVGPTSASSRRFDLFKLRLQAAQFEAPQ